jgi:hypothetical protein
MILTEIKQYLIARQAATLSDMAIHFDTTPEAMRDMLQIWVQKGTVKITSTHGENGCGRGCGRDCGTCADTATEVCRWRQKKS